MCSTSSTSTPDNTHTLTGPMKQSKRSARILEIKLRQRSCRSNYTPFSPTRTMMAHANPENTMDRSTKRMVRTTIRAASELERVRKRRQRQKQAEERNIQKAKEVRQKAKNFVKCPSCRKPVWDAAAYCGFCGRSMPASKAN